MKKYFGILCFLVTVFVAKAQWHQVALDIYGKVRGNEAGSSVSLSADGKIVAVGSPGNDGLGSSTGIVRVYRTENGNWVQIGTGIKGESAGDFFGRSVSISADGSIIAVGAPGNDKTGSNAGHVRVFKNINENWIQVGSDINGERQIDQSGWALTLSSDGKTIAIGAYNNWETGSSRGHVRVYRNQQDSWVQIGSDIDGEGAPGDMSGRSVSLSSDGNIVAIGAIGYIGGHVRIYKYDQNNWVKIGSDIAGEYQGDNLGSSVSLSSDGNIVAVGVPKSDLNGDNSGYARVYENINNQWVKVGSDMTESTKGDNLGCAVSLNADGSILAVGAWGYSKDQMFRGNVKVFKNKNGSWTQVGSEIIGKNAAEYLGSSVCLNSDGSTIAVGAWGNDMNGNNSGVVRVYSINEQNVSVKNTDDKKISIFSSPASNIITLAGSGMKSFAVYNSMGTLITKELNLIGDFAKIDLSKQTPGVYIICVKTNKKNITQKIILSN